MLDLNQQRTDYGLPDLGGDRLPAPNIEEDEPDGFVTIRTTAFERLNKELVAIKFVTVESPYPGAMPEPLPDLGLMTLEDFEEHHAEEHKTLAYRKLMRQRLTPREDVRLAILNRYLENLRPKRERLPDEVRDLVRSVLRRIPDR